MPKDYFNPKQFITLNATTTAAGGNITQPDQSDATTGSPIYNARVYNSGTSIVFVTFGGSGVTATSTTGLPIPAGYTEYLNMGRACKGVSAVASAGSANVYVSPG